MKTIQFQVDNKYIDIVLNLLNSLNGLKFNVIKNVSIVNSSPSKQDTEESEELMAFSHHTVNLIEEWRDNDEDNVWK